MDADALAGAAVGGDGVGARKQIDAARKQQGGIVGGESLSVESLIFSASSVEVIWRRCAAHRG
jgi:hypothetical protein